MAKSIDYESRTAPAALDATAPVVCPKCNSKMETGTIGRVTGIDANAAPAWTFLAGYFQAGLLSDKFTCVGEYPLIPCRCVQCGFVEIYAPEPR